MTELDRLAADAWVFGYPLVLMDVTRRVMLARGDRLNTFDHMRGFPDHTFTDVVLPNADTLYSTAWLDLRAEPVVLSLPDSGGRYHMMPLMSGWTDVFASPGTRTTGGEAAEYAICGPGFDGPLPAGVARIDAPTAMVRLIGRTNTAGTKDYLAVHALQDQYGLTPLSGFVDAPAPSPVDSAPPATDLSAPVDQVARMDGPAYFARLAELLVDNPPLHRDADAMAALATLGVHPGAPVEPASAEVAAALAGAAAGGRALLSREAQAVEADRVDGWTTLRGLGDYGTDYVKRAHVAFLGLGASLDADAMCPRTTVDSDGRPLVGDNHYVLHFAPDRIPPVNGFWSLTLYDDKQCFVDNPIDRYAIGDREDLVYADDGSLDIWVQHDDPGPAAHRNWLPAPPGAFNLVLRAYWPGEAILDGRWTPPPLTRLF